MSLLKQVIIGLTSVLVAISLIVQQFPFELKDYILHQELLENLLLIRFIGYSFIVSIILHLLLRNEKTAKKIYPLFLLVLMPFQIFFHIGSQITWFPQNQSYFLLLFIFIVSWTTANLFTGEKLHLKISHKHLIWLFVASTVIFSYFALVRLFDVRVEKPDSHIVMNVIYNTLHGKPFTISYLGTQSWFGLHFQPVLIVLAPLFLLPISPVAIAIILQVLQVVIGTSAVFPLYRLATLKTGSTGIALVLCVVYLLLPTLQYQILFDFHLEIISLAAIIWSFYFLAQKNYTILVLLLIAAALAREEFALYGIVIGLYMVFKKEYNPLIAILLMICGAVYWGFVKFALLPFFGQGSIAAAQEGMFAHLGTTVPDILNTIVNKPIKILSFMFTERKIQYLFLITAHTGFLAFTTPLFLLGVPFLLMNILLNFDLPSSLFWHYQSWLLPIILLIIIECISKKKAVHQIRLASYIVSFLFFLSLYFGPLNIMDFDLGTTHRGAQYLKKTISVSAIQKTLDTVGQSASVAADTGLAPFFSRRSDFYLFPDTMDADYIVASTQLFSRYLNLDATLRAKGYCLTHVENILLYRHQKLCPAQHQTLQDRRYPIFDLPETELVESHNTDDYVLPIYPIGPDKSAVFVLHTRFPNYSRTLSDSYLLDYSVLAQSPDEIIIELSPDTKHITQRAICSAYTDSFCHGLLDISESLNGNGEVYIKVALHPFAIKKNAQDIRIQDFFFRKINILDGNK